MPGVRVPQGVNDFGNWSQLPAPYSTAFGGPLRQVATNCWVAGAFAAGAVNQVTARTRYRNPRRSVNQVVVYSNVSGTGSVGAVDPLLIQAAIEYPTDTFTQLYFPGGGDSYVLQPGAQVATLPAGGLVIPDGATFWVRSYAACLPTSTRVSITLDTGVSAGTFTLTVDGQTTAGIAYNASLATVRAAIEALSSVGAGNVRVSGWLNVPSNHLGSSIFLDFRGAKADRAVTVSADGAGLTGGVATVATVAAGGPALGAMPAVQTIRNVDGEGAAFDGNYLLSTAPTWGFVSNTHVFAPSAVLGSTLDPNGPSVFLVGDSIGAGYSDSEPESDGALGGLLMRALGYATPYLRFTVAGYTLAGEATQGRFRHSFYGACKYLIVQGGNNDWGAGQSSAQMLANLQLVAQTARSAGCARVYACTLPPRTSSTDSWATVANQSLLPGNATRLAYNAALRGLATTPIPGVDGYFEVADACESSRNSNAWAVQGSANALGYTLTTAPTADGTHPSPELHGRMALQVNTALFV